MTPNSQIKLRGIEMSASNTASPFNMKEIEKYMQ
jgi:hypothetical protein